MKTTTAAALAAFFVGVPAGYVLSGVTNGSPPTASTASSQAQESDGPIEKGMSHNHGDMPESDASRAFREAAMKMHADMSEAPSGDVDVDFAQGMLPHHQGALEMARIEMRYGKDPEMRRLAEGVLSTQQYEIDVMRDWLAKRYGE